MIYILTALVLLALLAVFIAQRPSEFRVLRSAVITAPPAAVYAQVIDFHLWNAWSPWARLDPDAKKRFEGSVAGPGAVFHWAGNKKVGEGSMTIVQSNPSDYIEIKLEFLKPFTATNTAEFSFKPEGNTTIVTWSMFGRNSFISKAVSLFMNCEAMIGKQFEQGLANLKTVVETR